MAPYITAVNGGALRRKGKYASGIATINELTTGHAVLGERCQAEAYARFSRRVARGSRVLCITEGTAPPDALTSNYRVDVRGLWDDPDNAFKQYNGAWLADGLSSCGASRLSYALTLVTGCLRPGGVLYVAFLRGPAGMGRMAGQECGVANPRAMTREALQGLIARLPGVVLVDAWTTPTTPVRWLFGVGAAWLHALCVVGATVSTKRPRLAAVFPDTTAPQLHVAAYAPEVRV